MVIKDLDSANKVLERGHYAFERGETREAMNMYVKVAQSGYGTASVWSDSIGNCASSACCSTSRNCRTTRRRRDCGRVGIAR